MTLLFLLMIGSVTVKCQTIPENANKAPESLSSSQDIPEIKFVRKTPDGAYVVQIDGIQYRLLSSDEYRKVLEMNVLLESYKKQLEIHETTLADLRKTSDQRYADLMAKYEKLLEIERKKTADALALYEAEVEKGKKKDQVNKNSKVKTVLGAITSPVARGIVSILNFLVSIFRR